MFVDSHCHLNIRAWSRPAGGDRARARRRLLEDATLDAGGGMDDVIGLAGASRTSWRGRRPPHDADTHETSRRRPCPRARHPRCSLGESGPISITTLRPERQKASFRAHRRTREPPAVIVHTRDASRHLEILAEEMGGAFAASSTASPQAATSPKCLGLGLYISISVIVTFKNAKDLQEVAKAIPLERLLIETDSPFLAPVPHRGKPCEPAFVADTARFLAELRGESLEALASATSANFHRLFAKAAA